MEVIMLREQIPVEKETDVLVVGGGPAGTAAAVTAARMGVSVLLAEKEQCFGGAGTAAAVPAFMRFSDGIHFLAGGFGREIFERLYGDADFSQIEFPIEAEKLKRIYDELVEEAGVDYRFDTRFIKTVKEGGRVTGAVFVSGEKLSAFRAMVVIDATGNGSAAVDAGALFEMGDEEGRLMPATLCSLWNGADWSRAIVELGKDPDNRFLKEAFQDGVFGVRDSSLPGMWHLPDGMGGGNIGHEFGIDGTDAVSVSRGIVQARRRLMEYRRYYREYVPGYENVELTATGHVLGIRESRRLCTESWLTIEAYRNAEHFKDEIGCYCYPVDIHSAVPQNVTNQEGKEPGLYEKGYPKGKSYGIPYGCLIPKRIENMLTAGRCIGTDRMMNGSVRVMPCCYITGMAAGAAAAMAVRSTEGSVRQVNASELRGQLRRMGAFLP